ncbi:sensor histidine kinase [Comamonas composti]|uniref:sensor histidine kinase n=1 Tax=Comamonas composti TaxID=408558 RepID=UPI00040A49C5|nr:PAS domain-containing sensor histidine kinase [Comamonas composti]
MQNIGASTASGAAWPEDQGSPDSNPFVRLWRGYLIGRVLVATGLLLLQAWISRMNLAGTPLVWLVILGYLGLAIVLLFTSRRQPPQPQLGWHWLPVIGGDLAVICLLQLLQAGTLNYSALLAIPILISAALGNLLLAMTTTSGVTLLMLAWVSWMNQRGELADSQAYYQAGFACAGYFAMAYLTHELARRVRRERALARQSWQQAQTQEQVNALVIRHLDDGVLVIDARFCVHQANPAALRLLGLSPTENQPFALDSHEGWQQLQEAVRQSFELDRPISTAVHLQSPSHEGPTGLQLRTWLTELASPPQSDTGPGLSTRRLCVVFLHDLRELEARMRTEKLAAMGRMSAAVAHEIRNPLAAISQANALLAEDLGSEPAQQQLCRIVEQNSERLARIVDEVLDIARVQQHMGDAPPQPLALDAQVNQVCQEWAAQGQPPRQLLLHLDAPGQHVVFDAEHLRRVLVNLLDNAQRHRNHADQELSLQVLTGSAVAGQTWLQVWSDGQPLEPSVQRHLFEPFFSSQSRSSGLGLYICRELCQRYDASISYQRLVRPGPQAAIPGNAFSIVFRSGSTSAIPATLFDQIVV